MAQGDIKVFQEDADGHYEEVILQEGVALDQLFKVNYGTTLTTAANITKTNHCFKETFFDKSDNSNLTLLNADWEVGDWGVIRPIGDGQATINPENETVIISGGATTKGIGFPILFSCYLIDGDNKYFFIDGGTD